MRRDNKRAIIFFVVWAILVITIIAVECSSDTVADIRATILNLIYEGVPSHDIGARPAHPIIKDPAALYEISSAIVEASASHGLDPFLLVAIAFREGSFMSDKTGALGESSAFQMMDNTARIAQRIEPRCEINTIRGSAYCAAAWIAHWRDKCGCIAGSLAIYATGKSCKPVGARAEWVVKDRLALAKKLKQRSKKNEQKKTTILYRSLGRR